jgi:hypothetical protein
MTSASSLEMLLNGPSPGIVAGILVVAFGAAGAVLWMFIRLVVDPRADIADENEGRALQSWDEAGDPAYDDSFARSGGDESG